MSAPDPVQELAGKIAEAIVAANEILVAAWFMSGMSGGLRCDTFGLIRVDPALPSGCLTVWADR